MAKGRTHFVCSSCGGVQSTWMGKCPDCGGWDTLEKFTEQPVAAGAAGHAKMAGAWASAGGAGENSAAAVAAVPLPEIESPSICRLPSGIAEFDRVLGGGLVPGSVILLAGDPGIGKSTLLLQAAGAVARSGESVLYVSSEESSYQTKLRSERLMRTYIEDGVSGSGIDELTNLFVLAETNLARIVEQARKIQPRVMVLDSIPMVFKSDQPAAPGSVAQIRQCCMELAYLAKVSGMAIVLVGHVTKDGAVAGPKLLEHLVDTVLSFEGDRHHAHRVVRGIKNRFGTTLEVGLFEMTSAGLQEVASVGGALDPEQSRAGSVICPVMHGSRCLLVEIQALTAPGFPGSVKRRTSGLDSNRLAMLIAVLEKHGGLRLSDQDVFVSAVGGMRVFDPCADLALALAIAGAHYGRALPRGVAAVGEVGLGGEVRAPSQMQRRMAEAARLGYASVLGIEPDRTRAAEGSTVHCPSISEALGELEAAPKPG